MSLINLIQFFKFIFLLLIYFLSSIYNQELVLKSMNIFNNLQEQYDQLWKYIIRPTRNTYPEKSLGPQTFELEGKKIKRIDFQLINPRGYVIFCSHFVPLEEQKYPCVIYMHGNSSNRTEGMEYLGNLMRHNISLCTFDFSGCGNSQGDYVSLGFYQQDDLNQVVEHIRHRPQITSIALWGRSMGAVTGLLYMRKCTHICAAIFDSPFKSLKSLIEDLCKKNSKIPSLIIAGALKIIAGTIQQKANFDIYKLNPLKYQVPFLKYPVFFVVGMQDDMIPPEHTITLFQKYSGTTKYLEKVKGNHNDSRPQQCIQNVLAFLLQNLFQQPIQETVQKKKSATKPQKHVEQFNFFDDEDNFGREIENLSKETQDVDFFEESQQNKESKNNSKNPNQDYGLNSLGSSQNGLFEKHSESFSFTSILSNVFSAVNPIKDNTVKRGIDGYEKSIQRISRQIYIDETIFARKQKTKAQKYQQKLREQIKECKNKTFVKDIIFNLQTWAF